MNLLNKFAKYRNLKILQPETKKEINTSYNNVSFLYKKLLVWSGYQKSRLLMNRKLLHLVI